jgi:hypothetical protein
MARCGTMVGEWLTQPVEVPLWGVFVLTAYSARRLAEAASGLETLRRRPAARGSEPTSEAG